MIKLTSDSSNVDDYVAAVERTAGNHGKLFKATYDETSANRSRDELKARGYAVRVEHTGNMYRVYYSTFDNRLKCTDDVMNHFEKQNDGLYRALDRTAGVYDYSYDDGAIWRVVKYEDGEYLVKEVDDDDEGVVVRRQKQAGADEVTDVGPTLTARYGAVPDKLLEIINSNGVLRCEFAKILNIGGAKLD